jgi:hypothetical protein
VRDFVYYFVYDFVYDLVYDSKMDVHYYDMLLLLMVLMYENSMVMVLYIMVEHNLFLL